MNLVLKFRDRMTSIGLWLEEEFDNIISTVKGAFEPEHNSDGTHKAITADSVSASGDVSGDNLDMTGAGPHQLGQVLITDDIPDTSGADVGIRLGAASDGAWIIARGQSSFFSEEVLKIWNLFNTDPGRAAFPVLEIGELSGQFYIKPHTSYPVNLGTNGLSVDRISKLYINQIFERGRSTALGEWESYTPTWTNLTVGNGTQTARFTRTGKTVHFTIRLSLGSTSAVTGNMTVTTPTAHTGDAVPKGHVVVFNGTTAARYPGIALPSGSTAMNLFHAVSPMTIMNATNPKTFANLDQIYIWGSYEEP